MASLVARNKRQPPSDFEKNPYRGWSHEKLDKFLIELATIVGSGNTLLVGCGVMTQVFHQRKLAGDVPVTLNPYEECADRFFEQVPTTIAKMKAPWKRQSISFFFDQTDNREWISAVTAMFRNHQKQHRAFRELAFADKKLAPHLPLQAADMVAYRTRQMSENMVNDESHRVWPELDEALFKSTFDFFDTHPEDVQALTFLADLYRSRREPN